MGISPKWEPQTVGDYSLVIVFIVWYYISLAPLWLLNRLFGWSKNNWIILDFLSIPGKLLLYVGSLFGNRGKKWGLKANALNNIYFVCRLCPASRQFTRDPNNKRMCTWNMQWNNGNFDIAPDFGLRNYLKQFFGKVDLKEYKKLAKEKI